VSDLRRAGGLAYRECGERGELAALLVHGYPESSYMWRDALAALERAGWWGLAPDLPGYGDSPVARPATWERHIEALEGFVRALELPPVALVTHDWGVMIGLRWACDHPGAARALVISDGGFFADRTWHELAQAMRTPDEGERLIRGYTREGFAQALQSLSRGIPDAAVDAYWNAFADDERRLGQLDLYRSGDFGKLAPYEGALARLRLPTLILWGAQDRFATPRMAERFHAEIPGSEVIVLEQAGHFVWEDAPDETTRALVDFLERRVRHPGPAPPRR
jgi:haloalkane dehalogenase